MRDSFFPLGYVKWKDPACMWKTPFGVQIKGHRRKMLCPSPCLPPLLLASSSTLLLWHSFANVRTSFFDLPNRLKARSSPRASQAFSIRLELLRSIHVSWKTANRCSLQEETAIVGLHRIYPVSQSNKPPCNICIHSICPVPLKGCDKFKPF